MARRWVSLWYFPAILFVSLNTAYGYDLEDIRDRLEETSRQLTAATLKGDGESMLSFYADDAISLPNYNPMLRGKDAIRKHGEEMERTGFQFRKIDFRTSELWTCDDLVYEIGAYDVAFCVGDTTNVVSDHGKYMTIWEMDADGMLKIKVETWNADVYPCQ